MNRIQPKSECTQDYKRCRACLTFAEDSIYIFNSPSISKESNSYWDVLVSICSIEKENNVDFPQGICATCAQKIEACYEFKVLCENSDKILQDELKLIPKEIIDDLKVEITEEKVNCGINSIKEDTTDRENVSNENEIKINFTQSNLDITINDFTGNIKYTSNEGLLSNTNIVQQESFSCKTCGKAFAAINDLIKHLFPMECPQCEYKAKCRPDYNRHWKIHKNRRKKRNPLRCSYCGLNFSCNNVYQKHLTQSHPNKRLGCDFCKAMYYTPRSLMMHMKQKHPQEKIRCNFCDFVTYIYPLYPRHVYNEHGEIFQPKHCEFCDYSNVCGVTLGRHMIAAHGDKRSFECPKCKMKFFVKSARDMHVEKQHGNNQISFKKHFKIDQNLTNSKRDETSETVDNLNTSESSKEKKFKCDQCGQLFRWAGSLNRHMICVHENVSAFACTICDKRYKSKASLNDHMTKHTGIKSYECDECGKQFSTRTHIKRHLVVHNK